jgi:hypothetical protein
MTTVVTGTDRIREALRARGHKINTATLAKDLGLSSNTLDGFMARRIGLPVETLQALTKELFFGHCDLRRDH